MVASPINPGIVTFRPWLWFPFAHGRPIDFVPTAQESRGLAIAGAMQPVKQWPGAPHFYQPHPVDTELQQQQEWSERRGQQAMHQQDQPPPQSVFPITRMPHLTVVKMGQLAAEVAHVAEMRRYELQQHLEMLLSWYSTCTRGIYDRTIDAPVQRYLRSLPDVYIAEQLWYFWQVVCQERPQGQLEALQHPEARVHPHHRLHAHYSTRRQGGGGAQPAGDLPPAHDEPDLRHEIDLTRSVAQHGGTAVAPRLQPDPPLWDDPYAEDDPDWSKRRRADPAEQSEGQSRGEQSEGQPRGEQSEGQPSILSPSGAPMPSVSPEEDDNPMRQPYSQEQLEWHNKQMEGQARQTVFIAWASHDSYKPPLHFAPGQKPKGPLPGGDARTFKKKKISHPTQPPWNAHTFAENRLRQSYRLWLAMDPTAEEVTPGPDHPVLPSRRQEWELEAKGYDVYKRPSKQVEEVPLPPEVTGQEFPQFLQHWDANQERLTFTGNVPPRGWPGADPRYPGIIRGDNLDPTQRHLMPLVPLGEPPDAPDWARGWCKPLPGRPQLFGMLQPIPPPGLRVDQIHPPTKWVDVEAYRTMVCVLGPPTPAQADLHQRMQELPHFFQFLWRTARARGRAPETVLYTRVHEQRGPKAKARQRRFKTTEEERRLYVLLHHAMGLHVTWIAAHWFEGKWFGLHRWKWEHPPNYRLRSDTSQDNLDRELTLAAAIQQECQQANVQPWQDLSTGPCIWRTAHDDYKQIDERELRLQMPEVARYQNFDSD